jgi:hypothetical protein
MNQWANFERSQNAAAKAQLNKEIYECNCGCTWFEQLQVNQFVSENQIVPGQKVPPLNGEDFYLLKCVKCSALTEPRTMLNNPTSGSEKKYIEVMSDLTAPTSEEVATEDAVQDPGQK